MTVGVAIFVSWLVSVAEGGSDALALSISASVSLVVGGLLWIPFARDRADLRRRESLLIVVFSWIGMSLLGALPFLLSGRLEVLDSLFESVSGFTTTGASVIGEIEALPCGLLFWRSLTHWLGGLGIIVLAVAILPFLRLAGYQLLATEAPAMDDQRLHPRIAQTARTLFAIYASLTALEVLFLLAGDMTLYDAVTHAFGTIATGGFSTRNASVGAYRSVYIDMVIVVFMFLGAVPFGLHYHGIRRPRTYLYDPQLRFFAGVLLGACTLVTVELWGEGVYDTLGEAARYAFFQVTSLMTTTGFATADSEGWTSLSKVVLLAVMFIGGCTGSTSGAIKVFRFIVLWKVAMRDIFRMLHPRAVRPVMIGGQVIGADVIAGAEALFVVYLLTAVLGTGILIAIGMDGLTALSGTAATLGGVGPGLGGVGPYDNYAWIPAGGKVVFIALMLLGRLEIFVLAVLFTPRFWKR